MDAAPTEQIERQEIRHREATCDALRLAAKQSGTTVRWISYEDTDGTVVVCANEPSSTWRANPYRATEPRKK